MSEKVRIKIRFSQNNGSKCAESVGTPMLKKILSQLGRIRQKWKDNKKRENKRMKNRMRERERDGNEKGSTHKSLLNPFSNFSLSFSHCSL